MDPHAPLPSEAETEPGLLESLRQTLIAVRSYVAELAELVVVEAHLSLTTLVVVGALAITLALLAVTAWLALVAGAVALVVGAGAGWPVALFGAAVLNGLACIPLGMFIRRLIRGLGFPATRENMALERPRSLGA